MKLNVIVATDKNNVIGSSETNSIPWHLPEDLAHFQQITKKCPIIMGSNTYRSLPKLLPNRLHVVITSSPETVFPLHSAHVAFNKDGNSLLTFSSLAHAIYALRKIADRSFVIGGERLYADVIENFNVDTIYLTEVDLESAGDIYFPTLDNEKWTRILSYPMTMSKTGISFRFTEIVKNL
jgi:dihydrofolate reductase